MSRDDLFFDSTGRVDDNDMTFLSGLSITLSLALIVLKGESEALRSAVLRGRGRVGQASGWERRRDFTCEEIMLGGGWWLRHYFTASLCYCFTVPLLHCAIDSLCHCCTALLIHWAIDSLLHYATASLSHWVTSSLLSCFTPSVLHSLTASLLHSFTSLRCFTVSLSVSLRHSLTRSSTCVQQ
jgi:hypothetical protein